MDTGPVIWELQPQPIPKKKTCSPLAGDHCRRILRQPTGVGSGGVFMTIADDAPWPDRVEAGEVILGGPDPLDCQRVALRPPRGWLLLPLR
jgi:hypothetical protein